MKLQLITTKPEVFKVRYRRKPLPKAQLRVVDKGLKREPMSKKLTIYLIVGVPGSGKSFVCEQLEDKFEYIRNDDYIGSSYVEAIKATACAAGRPLLIEAPFSISQVKDPLEASGYKVVPIFILEEPHVVSHRYMARTGKAIPKGHLTRMNTYRERAEAWGSFAGTSAQVLAHLKKLNVGGSK